jgi:hypothetical protein
MTRRALFSTSELKRLAEVANAEGVTVELEREGTIIRVMPFTPSRTLKQKPSPEEEGEAAWAAWEASKGKRR